MLVVRYEPNPFPRGKGNNRVWETNLSWASTRDLGQRDLRNFGNRGLGSAARLRGRGMIGLSAYRPIAPLDLGAGGGHGVRPLAPNSRQGFRAEAQRE